MPHGPFSRQVPREAVLANDINELQAALEASPTLAEFTPVQTAAEAAAATATLLAYNIYDPADAAYGAVRDDSSSATRTANTAAINAAAADALAAEGTLIIKGTYYVDPGVVVACNMDGSAGTLMLNTTSGAGLLYGSRTSGDEVYRRYAILPKVINEAYAGTGWGGGANTDIGVELANCYSCRITVPHVRRFTTNVLVSAYGTGNVYNVITLGHLDNGRINLDIGARDASGWANQSVFMGGRLSQNSDEGTAVAGTRQIRMRWYTGSVNYIDNHLFLNPSMEGNVAEHHVEFANAKDCTIVQGRWESTAGPKILFDQVQTARNIIFGGVNSNSITATYTNGAAREDFYTWGDLLYGGSADGYGVHLHRNGLEIHGMNEGIALSDISSASRAVLTVLDPASTFTTALTAYRVQASASFTQFKNGADSQPRLRITNASGGMDWGSGSATVDTSLSRKAANVLGTGSDDGFRTGTVTTAGRPTASSMGAGTQLYDTTLNKPIWSDGTSWRDAAGTVV